MPFRSYSPGAALFGLAVAGIMTLLGRSRKRTRRQHQGPTSHEDANIAAMRKVVAKYDGYSAEVINIIVTGRKRVKAFRNLSPGAPVELSMKKGAIKLFAFGEYVAELFPLAESNLPRLFNEHVPFDAYLGGRDRAYLSSDTLDACSIIVFYKLEGVPPTKVNLR